jgi:hypothetical protein
MSEAIPFGVLTGCKCGIGGIHIALENDLELDSGEQIVDRETRTGS